MSTYCFDYKVNFYNKHDMSAQKNQRDLGYNPKELGNLSYLSGMLTNEIMLIILVYKGLFSLISSS